MTPQQVTPVNKDQFEDGFEAIVDLVAAAGGHRIEFLLSELRSRGEEGEALAEAIGHFAGQADNIDQCLSELKHLAGANEITGRLAPAFGPYLEGLKGANGGPNFKVFTSQTGAAAAVPHILKYPSGASQYLVNSTLPYHQGESHKFVQGVGFEDGSVTEYAALSLAGAAYYELMESILLRPRLGRGGEPGPDENPSMIAVGVSAATATERARRGEDHIWIAVRTLGATFTAHVDLGKGHGQSDRDRQDAMCNVLGVSAVLATAGLPQMPILDDLLESDQLVENPDGPGRILDLKEKTVDPAVFEGPGPFLFKPNGELATQEEMDALLGGDFILYPGSFQLTHFGHEQAATEAEAHDRTLTADGDKREVVYEICADNFDPNKGSISNEELARRVVQNFGRHHTVVTRGQPLITQKLQAFPNVTRVIAGYDVAKAFVRDTSYAGGEQERDEALQLLQRRDGIMYVLGRNDSNGHFRTASDIAAPRKYSDIFKSLVGQAPISSTALRALAANLAK